MRFYSDLVAMGCSLSGCDSNGNVHWIGEPQNALAALVFAAMDKSLSSTECLALQAAVTEEQWAAYVEARKAPVQIQREARYKAETDGIFMKACEDYAVGSPDWNAAIEGWKKAKAAIREELSYPE